MDSRHPIRSDQLILRAMQEDHAALRARSNAARRAHEDMAERLRAQALKLRDGQDGS